MRKPARKASPTPVGSALRTSRATPTSTGSSPRTRTVTPSLPRVLTCTRTRSASSSSVQPVFWQARWLSYSLVKRYSAPSIRRAMVGPSQKASCCEGSAANGMPRDAALVGVAQHGLGVVGPDDDEVETADPVGDRRELDVAGLGHGPGVEGRDLGHVAVGRADEARGVLGLGVVHAPAVDAVALEPAAVVGEVLTDRADEQRALAEVGHAERDVGGHPTPAHLQVRGRGTTGRSCRAARRRASRRSVRRRS